MKALLSTALLLPLLACSVSRGVRPLGDGVTAVTATAGAVEFVDHYKVGLAAIENEDWELASDMMSRAIELQPEKGLPIAARVVGSDDDEDLDKPKE